MKTYSIDDLERAINIWRNRQAADDDYVLAPQARVLAAPYTHMIIGKRATIGEDELSADECSAMQQALYPADSYRSE